ncbi:MAG: ABC-three component system protein [Pseudomonadales bacterium]
MEFIDDVSAHTADDVDVVEQCKSALKSNPISDWSPQLWKTILNWVKHADSKLYDASKVRFILYVTPVRSGQLARKLSNAATEADVDKTLRDVLRKRRRRSTAPPCDAALFELLTTCSRTSLIDVIKNFKLVCEDDPLESIYAHLDATVSPEVREPVAEFGIGRASHEVAERIKEEAPPLVSVDLFRTHFRAFVKKHDHTALLQSVSEIPSSSDVENSIALAPYFVQQLRLVDATMEKTVKAVSDFLRASADRTAWADEGLIFESSLEEYNDTVRRRFSNIRDETLLTQPKLKPEKQGDLIYVRCCMQENIPLEGRVVPSHYLPGTLNDLANRLEVGWHPHYMDLLQPDGVID